VTVCNRHLIVLYDHLLATNRRLEDFQNSRFITSMINIIMMSIVINIIFIHPKTYSSSPKTCFAYQKNEVGPLKLNIP